MSVLQLELLLGAEAPAYENTVSFTHCVVCLPKALHRPSGSAMKPAEQGKAG